MSEQPEALRLAAECDTGHPLEEDAKQAAAELRRLHALNGELLEVLLRIATVNAMDYEYQAWARAAIAKSEAQK